MFHGIDLYSDTVTKPTLEMRKAMMIADVGDEQKGEDPTTLKLEEMSAELLGHTAALFFPSATMANEVAIRALCEPGDELFAAGNCHLYLAESGGPAIHSGVMCKSFNTPNGIFTGLNLRENFRYATGPLYPVSKLVSVENTTNMGGGLAWTTEQITDVIETARALKLKTHMDGSRFLNACVKEGYSPPKIAHQFDMVTLCLSKGLGCPAGALLAFDKALWPKVRRLKQLMGGSLRQSGFLAAAGIYALKNHVSRLEEDHAHATRLAVGLSQGISTLTVENTAPSTNMVYFEWQSKKINAETFLDRCLQKKLRFSLVGPSRFRAVTHLDIKREDIDSAVGIVKEISLDC